MPRRLFKKEELERIEARIGEVEARTSGEIVTVVVRASSDYLWVRWLWAGIGAVLGSLAIVALERSGGRSANTLELLETQVFGAVTGAWLSLLPPLRRLVLPARQTAWRVHREALASFSAAGLHETRDRTGILVYLSELERRVVILADRGIHAQLGESYWKERVTEIVSGIRGSRAAEALLAALDKMGAELATHFPPRPVDRNELPNAVRTDSPR
jgi:putative membrane protein